MMAHEETKALTLKAWATKHGDHDQSDHGNRDGAGYTPRDNGVELRLTSAQRDFIAGREQQTDGQRRTWDHVAAQLRDNPSSLNVDADDLNELRAVAEDEADIHRFSDRGEYSAGERAIVRGLISKIDSMERRLGKKYYKHADHDQSDHGNRDGGSVANATSGKAGASMAASAARAISE
jgi:hypothetical protein